MFIHEYSFPDLLYYNDYFIHHHRKYNRTTTTTPFLTPHPQPPPQALVHLARRSHDLHRVHWAPRWHAAYLPPACQDAAVIWPQRASAERRRVAHKARTETGANGEQRLARPLLWSTPDIQRFHSPSSSSVYVLLCLGDLRHHYHLRALLYPHKSLSFLPWELNLHLCDYNGGRRHITVYFTIKCDVPLCMLPYIYSKQTHIILKPNK